MTTKWLAPWKQGTEQLEAEPRDVRDVASSEMEKPAAGLTLPVSADVIIEALKEVEDPELGISIVELGLIYAVEAESRKVHIIMTLTSPGCPIGPMLQAAVHGAVKRVFPDVEDVKIDLVWNPPWDPYRMASEEAKDLLGIW